MAVRRASWDAAALVAAFPPRFIHPNKRAVIDIACPAGSAPRGRITASRWEAMALPVDVPAATPTVEGHDGFFTYDVSMPGWFDWHLNFADPVLFVAYGGGLFAQDEMQVTEHPTLASIPAALAAEGIPPRTVEGDTPTPVLVTGVERRCELDTAPSLDPGRTSGLYGNRFARAPEAVIRAATRRIDPPTLSNIVAMAALPGGRGRYRRDEVETILVTAYTGFSAAVEESSGARVAIHTGFWGCGAYGGDRVLMTVLQLLAARLAGVDALTMHLGDGTGRRDLAEASQALEGFLAGEPTVAEWIGRVVDRGYSWGTSDGN